jgi:hypothetical protein
VSGSAGEWGCAGAVDIGVDAGGAEVVRVKFGQIIYIGVGRRDMYDPLSHLCLSIAGSR